VNFRGSKFKDTKVTKGTKVYKQSSWFYKTKKEFFVYFRVFRGSKFKGTKAKPKVLVAMSLSSSRIVFWATVYVLVYKDVWASGNGFTIATTM
jgi:hypothetical protein